MFHFVVHRSHLREIRDRSVLRLFESNEVTAPQVLPGGPGVPQPLPSNGGHWDQDQVSECYMVTFYHLQNMWERMIDVQCKVLHQNYLKQDLLSINIFLCYAFTKCYNFNHISELLQ